MRAAAAASVAALLAAAWWRRRQGDELAAGPVANETGNLAAGPDDAAGWAETITTTAQAAISNLTGAAMETITATDEDQAARNQAAFLRMIRSAEGTAGPDGYRTLFGGRLFDSFADHPRIAQQFTDRAGRRLWTTAAGAYQFMAASPLPGGGSTKLDTWGELQRRLKLPDFGPASQDAAALELIRQAGAFYDVRAGRLVEAVEKVKRIWASMPGAGYAQPERKMTQLVAVYLDVGGVLA